MTRLFTWVGLASVVSFVAVGCDGSTETGTARSCEPGSTCPGGDAGPAPGDVVAFCHRFQDAFAEYMKNCGCDATTVQHYRDQTATRCDPAGFFGELSGAVAAGDMLYHPEAASALFARLEGTSPACVEETFRALGLDSQEVFSFGGVFSGTHALGTPCMHPVGYKGGVNDCREGYCARNTSGSGGVCIALVGVGEACDGSGDENFNSTVTRLCFDRREADIDGEYESAFDSLVCVATTPGGTSRTCMRDLADGQPCKSGIACRSGRCLGTGVPNTGQCAPKLADGQPCTSHGDCSSGACQHGTPRVCGALLPDGEACDYSDTACASGGCNDPLANGGVCGPRGTRAIGEACSSSVECASLGHGSSRDGTCSNGRCIADVCANYL